MSRRTRTATALTLGLLALPGCSASTPAGPPPPGAATSSASQAPTEAELAAAALAVPAPPLQAPAQPEVALTTGAFTDADAVETYRLTKDLFEFANRNPELFTTQAKTEEDLAPLLDLVSSTIRPEVRARIDAFLQSRSNAGTGNSKPSRERAEELTALLSIATATTAAGYEGGEGTGDLLANNADPAGWFGPASIDKVRVYDSQTVEGPLIFAEFDATAQYRGLKDGKSVTPTLKLRKQLYWYDKADGSLKLAGWYIKNGRTFSIPEG